MTGWTLYSHQGGSSMWNGVENYKPPSTLFPFMYPAEVVNGEDDADADSGRVQVRVFPMMAGLATAVLPWAVPAFPLLCGAASDQGSWAVPVTGSRVWVFFAGGDPMNPVYWAEAPGATDGPTGRTVDKRIWKTPAGHVITLDDTDGSETITIEHANGETIVLTEDNVELGSGTLKKLIKEEFKTLYDAHVHVYRSYGIDGAAAADWITTAPVDPNLTPVVDPAMVATGTPKGITDAEMTDETRAS